METLNFRLDIDNNFLKINILLFSQSISNPWFQINWN